MNTPSQSRSKPSKPDRAGIVDVHAHVIAGEYAAFLSAHGVRLPGLPALPSWAPPVNPMSNPGDSAEHITARLLEMDQAGVATQILSPTITPFFEDEAVAVQAATLANDTMLNAARRAPDRFRVFAVLPIPHLEAARTELGRVLGDPAVAGVTLSCFYGERSAADAYFDPLYRDLGATSILRDTAAGDEIVRSYLD